MIERFLQSLGSILYVQIWESRLRITNIKTGEIYDDEPLMAIRITSKRNKEIREIIAIGSKSKSLLSSDTKIINPFSHPRVLFANFSGGEKLLQHAFHQLHAKKLFSPAPVVVIHPMEKIEGGLTQIEHRAFKEMAAGAGAREIAVYSGPELSMHRFDYQAMLAADKELESEMAFGGLSRR